MSLMIVLYVKRYLSFFGHPGACGISVSPMETGIFLSFSFLFFVHPEFFRISVPPPGIEPEPWQ